MEREVWKDVPGYEGKYQGSTFGRFKSLNYRRCGYEKIMSPAVVADGYLKIGFRKNGKKEWFSCHRLIAEMFIPNPDNLPEVNHIDYNRQNNRVDNLEWTTIKDNRRHSLAKKVACYDLGGNLIKVYDCIADTEKDGFKHSKVSAVALGKMNKHHNHYFKFVD